MKRYLKGLWRRIICLHPNWKRDPWADDFRRLGLYGWECTECGERGQFHENRPPVTRPPSAQKEDGK